MHKSPMTSLEMWCSVAELITEDFHRLAGKAMTEEGISKEGFDAMKTAGFGWRVAVSILVFFGWLIFLIIWLFFYAVDYSVFQNLAMVLVSIIAGIGILAGTWVTWGMRFAKQFDRCPPEVHKPKWPSALSGIAGVGWLIFIVIWLFFYADEFTGYQNLAIVIVSIMVLAGISTAAWASWGTRFVWKR